MAIKLLLDTHTLLWSLHQPAKLSAKVRDLIQNPENIRLVSSASLWEIAVKTRLGKLAVGESFLANYPTYLRTFRAEELFIRGVHCVLAPGFPSEHKDPFDRILAAQSQVEQALLLTDDPRIQTLGVATVW